MSLEELALLNELLIQRYGLHYPEHKREILASRLAPRLRANHLQRFLDYYLLLSYDFAREQDHLIRSITNNETYFLREMAQLEALQQMPVLDHRRRALRILSAGCSSGEEPYTLRILDRRQRLGGGFEPAEIDALDIDSERLDQAREARFGRSSLRSMTREQIDQYFDHHDAGWTLRTPYRQNVRFRRGNLVDLDSMAAEAVQPYDVIFCRNVLIYFEEGALRRAIDNFAALLRPGGLLCLGHAESIIGLTRKFQAERVTACIVYRRCAT